MVVGLVHAHLWRPVQHWTQLHIRAVVLNGVSGIENLSIVELAYARYLIIGFIAH
jgi:hypothetical protein